MMPNTSVSPAASRNSSRPNCNPFRNCSTTSSMETLGRLPVEQHHQASRGASWFETRGAAALLTMRDLMDLILRRREAPSRRMKQLLVGWVSLRSTHPSLRMQDTCQQEQRQHELPPLF